LLVLKEGNEKVITLHDELYTGILSPYLRRDLEFIPHIGLALFARRDAGYNALNPKVVDFDEKRYRQALAEAESLKIDSFNIIDRSLLDRVILKGRGYELFYKFVDRRTFRLSGT
jgi:hypothetical protein